MLIIPILGMIINPLFNHKGSTIFFFINNNAITRESALYGLTSGILITATLIWFSTFTKIMTSDKLLYVFGSISPKLALILSMTLRYIPLFKAQVIKTNNAQKAMGLYKDDTVIDKLRGGMRVFSVMVTWALENGVITADSMTARGYGVGKRSRFAIFKWSKSDIVLLFSSIAMSILTCSGMITGKLSYEWFPMIIPPENGFIELGCYICFSILAILPIYLEIKEKIKWKSLTSKI